MSQKSARSRGFSLPHNTDSTFWASRAQAADGLSGLRSTPTRSASASHPRWERKLLKLRNAARRRLYVAGANASCVDQKGSGNVISTRGNWGLTNLSQEGFEIFSRAFACSPGK